MKLKIIVFSIVSLITGLSLKAGLLEGVGNAVGGTLEAAGRTVEGAGRAAAGTVRAAGRVVTGEPEEEEVVYATPQETEETPEEMGEEAYPAQRYPESASKYPETSEHPETAETPEYYPGEERPEYPQE